MNTEYYYDGTNWVERELSTKPVTEPAKLPKNTVIVTEVDGAPKAFSYYLGRDGYYVEKSQDGIGYTAAGGTYPAGYNPELGMRTTTATVHTTVKPMTQPHFSNHDFLIVAATLAIVTCHIITLVVYLKGRKK